MPLIAEPIVIRECERSDSGRHCYCGVARMTHQCCFCLLPVVIPGADVEAGQVTFKGLKLELENEFEDDGTEENLE